LDEIYNSNRKKVFPTVVLFIILFTIAPILLLRFARVTNSIPSFCVLIFSVIGMTQRFYHELTLKLQVSDNGLSFKYSKTWQIVKWKYIERVEYKKSSREERIIIYFPNEQELSIGVRTNQYKKLWKEIYCYLCKHNTTAIIDELFISRIKELD